LVPYAQAVRLHEALVKAGVPTQLITIPGGGHGLFGVEATRDAWAQVFDFLQKAGLTLRPE
jgi:dipeptidyl aminopeptidase/acylaminoacyl peptidase